MLCKVYCACCSGIDAIIVTIEVDVSPGISFFLVGLPDNAVKESQQRIGAALNHYGYRIPGKKIIINMAPADMKKEGSAFDVAIALGIICASEQIPENQIPLERFDQFLIMGELALDGTLRAFPGALPIAAHAAEYGFKGCIFPPGPAEECTEIDNISIFAAKDIGEVIEILRSPETAADKLVSQRADTGKTEHSSINASQLAHSFGKGGEARCLSTKTTGEIGTESLQKKYEYDFADVKGQETAKAGLEIAAAGGHNILLIGSPGCGKTLLAKCLPSILPPLTKEEGIETSKIYSVSGLLPSMGGFIKERPFRAPHHTSTIASLIGGGTAGLPGEISLAHNGILYLDEFGEFSRQSLEILRQPIEDGIIQVSRVKNKYTYPASFMLVASMNPCPCGFLNDESGRCTCSSSAIARYLGHISGPILDRIDIQIYVRPVPVENMLDTERAESSRKIAERVLRAREIQYNRYRNKGFYTNARIPASQLEHYCKTGPKERNYIKEAIKRLGLSARGYSRILKISRTIADLDGEDFISLSHISRAVQFRNLDRTLL